ncbi:VanZ family protein [Mucilaginibacter mali]|uniref:VanZ family protein n=1 Tax=Mucilaginibacter mali TaxID=2740462 RepID=A0A7D4TPB3_9SPHI|nr:VanZ family protein [Mucilaginibacter mali]QKJ31653.1 VanZ family protein [Mucilaginibacter mali]
MLHQILKQALFISGITLPLWLVFRIVVNSYKKRQGTGLLWGQELKQFVLYVYIICVLMITVMPLPMTRHHGPKRGHINILPIANTAKQFNAVLARGTHGMMVHALENIVGNVILFLPLGICLPMLWPQYFNFKRVLLTAFLFSLTIELTQLFSRQFGIYRSVDVDDVILNTCGAILGFATIGRLFRQKRVLNQV